MIDLHMHTIYSDGKNSIEEMVITSIELGLKKIAITDHIWKSCDWFENYVTEIILLRQKYSEIKILIGFEAKALSLSGEIDAAKDTCKKADIRIGSIHRIPKNEFGKFLTKEEITNNKELAYKNWLNTTKNMIKNPNVDIIGHPFMVLDRYNIKVNKSDVLELFSLVKNYNTKLEVSSRYSKSNKYIIDILYNKPNYINLISYGSDSHSIENLINV